MKRLGDVLMQTAPFEEILMGNEVIVRAMLETQTAVVSSYPGSPTPEIATAINNISKDRNPLYFEFSVNEKVATEVAFGAALNGNLSCVFFKSVGLNVALDTFVQLGLMPITGGMIVVLGDDPGANSSQNEQDNRNIFKMARLTVFEPSSPSEVYVHYLAAAELARKEKTAVVLRLTTHVCHSREKVAFGALSEGIPRTASGFNKGDGPYIPITNRAIDMKRESMKILSNALVFVKNKGLNQVIPGDTVSKKGIITAGMPYLSVLDVLERCNERPDILKLAVVNPLDLERINDFLKTHDDVLILEELDDILETAIKAHAWKTGVQTMITGKTMDEDYIGEYTPDKVMAIMERAWPGFIQEPLNPVEPVITVPERPAQMCPGCGHRSAFHAIKKALNNTDITVADIGCHTLGFLPPYNVGEVLMCMGASTGIASGLSLFNAGKKVVAFLGDSTFFHAGIPGILNTIFNRHNITLIIMENGTTAMTGHQDHAGREIPIENLLKGLGVKHIFSCDTYQQQLLTDHVTAALGVEGLSIVIAKHPCMLKFTRAQQKKPGYKKHHVEIDDDVCTRIHQCVEVFGCPSFVRQKDGNIDVNLDLCIGDGSCRQVCPKDAIAIAKEEHESV